MIDAVLDWEHDLPEPFYSDSISKCKKADLSIVLGSSLQIQPGKFHYIDEVRFFLTFLYSKNFSDIFRFKPLRIFFFSEIALGEGSRNSPMRVNTFMRKCLEIPKANKLPTMSKKMAIINLSKTKMDSKSKLIINGKCDQVMKMVMNGLNLEPEKYFGPCVIEKRPKRKLEDEKDHKEDLKNSKNPKIESKTSS